MANISIEQVIRKTSVKYKARVREVVKGRKTIQKTKTFSTEAQAKSWAKKFKEKVEIEGFSTKNTEKKSIMIRDLITLYLEDENISHKIGKTKAATLRALCNYDIGLINSHEITANDLVEHCRQRKNEPHSPKKQTIYHEVSYLKTVMEIAEPLFGFSANTDYHHKATPTLVQLDLIGRSDRRERRPTSDELVIMEQGLFKRQSHKSSKIPLVDIFNISILTCMRASEITRVVWDDLDEENRTLIIRNRKDPRNKRGNDSKIPLSDAAFKIIKAQSITANRQRIFPYDSNSVGAAWQAVCKLNGIEDLHYHDLRAEGACRLIEQGKSIVEVSKITGHKDLNVLNNVYLRLNVNGLQY